VKKGSGSDVAPSLHLLTGKLMSIVNE